MYAFITSDDFDLVVRSIREHLPRCSRIEVTREDRHYRITISEIPARASTDGRDSEDSAEPVQVM